MNLCYADWKVDSKASEANGIVSCPGVENTRLINGRPADARFRV